MVNIRVDLDQHGHILALDMNGHMGARPKGSNLACAALSLLVRSIARLLESRLGSNFSGNAAKPGNLSFAIQYKAGKINQWLLGVTDSLIQGLNDVDQEYPGSMVISISKM